MSDKPELDDSKWAMFPYAVTTESGIEVHRNFIEAERDTPEGEIDKLAREDFIEETHQIYGGDDGKLYGTLGQAKKLVVGDPMSYEQYGQRVEDKSRLQGRSVEIDESHHLDSRIDDHRDDLGIQ